ncbi:MAG: Holliday junction branch migration protein RuvA [Clostridia bacterium]|nr:Holliday junction branch migration protein RuvA [Clostridia bacterium]
MFYYISGTLVLLDSQTAVIDAGGVGYKLSVSGTTCGKLAGLLNHPVKLYTYLSVREDNVELFGFYSLEELSAFRLLINVSGIGAKSAISVLTQLSPERLSRAVISGDVKSIAAAQGIGSKTAARIVLELKDKVAKEIGSSDEASMGMSEVSGDGYGEAMNALAVLGYTRQEASYALKGAPAGADVETLIRFALGKLMKG